MSKKKAAEPNLFGVQPKPRATPDKPKTPDGAMSRVIALTRELHEGRFAEPPVVTKRDAALLKTLVLKFGEGKVAERLRAYYAWEDRYVAESGYAIHVFYREWNRLTAKVQREATRHEVPDLTDYLAKMKGKR